MAKIHFFTETGDSQDSSYPFLTNSGNFGPISNSEYLVTSIHQWSGSDPKAYAVSSGSVRYQQDTHNPNLLNAVIKLDLQTKLKGLPIKYLIYRGIKRDSLLSNQTDLIDPNNTQVPENHILKKIWEGVPDVSTDYLTLGLGIKDNANQVGEELQVGDNESLDKLFTHNYNKTPWKVSSGTILGNFDKSKFGFEIILESAWKKPKISIVRKVDITQGGHKITINHNDSVSKQKADREEILNYLDPVCLWSSFYNEKIVTETQIFNSRKEVYEDILSLYQNKSRVYLDIRNTNNLSLNYYGNYGKIGLKDHNDAVVQKDYNANSWPIYILDTSQYISMTNNEDSTKIELALPIDDNTLNMCFIMHGRIYIERNGFFGDIGDFFFKESKAPKNDKQFLNLTENSNNPGITDYFNLSTFQYTDDQNNKKPVASYMRFIYGKQMEADPINNSKVIGAGHVLDNLFTLRPLAELLDVKETFGFRAWFDGNMRYVARDDVNNKGKSIHYSGIYKTGVAVGGGNITLFAIPFAIDGKGGDQVKMEVPSAGSSNEIIFMESFTAGNKGKIKFQPLSETGVTTNNEYNLLSLYDDPDPSKAKNTDSDAFLGITMTENEYDTIAQNLSSFKSDLHPIFAQIRKDNIPEVTENGVSIREIKLQLGGYKLVNNSIEATTLELNSGNIPSFYGLAINGSQYFNTKAAYANANEPVEEFPKQIQIDHENDTEEYDEIRNALILNKIYLRRRFYQIQKLISAGRMDTVPVLSNGGSTHFKKSKSELRKYNIKLKYYDIPDPTTGDHSAPSGKTCAPPAMIDYKDNNDTIQSKKSTYKIADPDTGDNGTDAASYVNKDKYEDIAASTNFKKPKEIAAQFNPKVFIYDEVNGGYIEKSINKLPLLNSGRALISKNITIRISDKFRISNSDIFKEDDPLKLTIYGETTPNPSGIYHSSLKGNFKGLNKRILAITPIIAHELGHALYAVEKPLSQFSWIQILEYFYKNNPGYSHKDPQAENFPSYTGDGHLEGNPSGNLAAENEFHIGKNMIENDLWKQGMELIDLYGNTNNKINNEYILKVHAYTPSYLETDKDTIEEKDYVLFKIRTYLAGNIYLTDEELPDDIYDPNL